MKDLLLPVVIAVVSSNAFFAFIQFLITRRDNNNKKFKAIEERFDKVDSRMNYIDQGNLRLQILVLIHLYPQRSEEIIKLAKKYFVDFKGNYYVTGIFKQYLDDNNLIYPQWFIDYKDN